MGQNYSKMQCQCTYKQKYFSLKLRRKSWSSCSCLSTEKKPKFVKYSNEMMGVFSQELNSTEKKLGAAAAHQQCFPLFTYIQVG